MGNDNIDITGELAQAAELSEVLGPNVQVKVLGPGDLRDLLGMGGQVPAGPVDYATLPHLDIDKLPKDCPPEEHAGYLRAIATVPEEYIGMALESLFMDLVLAHGIHPQTAEAGIADFARRCRERFPEAEAERNELAAKIKADLAEEHAKGDPEALLPPGI